MVVVCSTLLAGCGGGGFIHPSNQAQPAVHTATFSFAESTTTISGESLNQTIEIIRRRRDQLGVARPEIQRATTRTVNPPISGVVPLETGSPATARTK
jgi:preprotein translocase subunit SecD